MDFGTLTLYRRGEQPQPFRLRLGSLSIGSDPAADISIEDGQVERFHVRVVCTPAGCQLSDLGSAGGTFVNKERLRPHAPRMLQAGDRIQLGRVGLLYSAPAAPVSSVAPPQSTLTTAPGGDVSAPANGEHQANGGLHATDGGADAQPAPTGGGAPPQPTPTNGGGVAGQPAPTGGGAPPQPAPANGGAPAQTAVATRPGQPPALAADDEWNLMFEVPIVADPGRSITRLPGNRRPRRLERDLPYAADDYLALLPPIYQDQDERFLRRFLLIFRSVLDPLDRQIAQIHHYFDPRTAPEQLLPWLAAWVDLVLDDRWPEDRRRELIVAASTLYRWRGTRRGLGDYLRIFTGVEPRIVEQGQERPGEAAVRPHTFRVIIALPPGQKVDRALVERIIESEKPAHTDYQLEIQTAP